MALVVRLSATDWTEGGLTVEDTIAVARWLADHGVHLLDVSTAGNVPASIPVGPGYQTRFAAQIRDATGVPTGAVGLITDPEQAEQTHGLGTIAILAMQGLAVSHMVGASMNASRSLIDTFADLLEHRLAPPAGPTAEPGVEGV